MAVPVTASNATTVTDVTGTTLTITKPSGVASGDLLVAFVHVSGSPTLTPPSGWTLIDSVTNAFGVGTLYAFRFMAGGSEPASYSWTWTGSQYSCGGIYRVTGADATTPINTSAKSAPASGATQVSPSVTTTTADCLILRAISCERTATSPYSWPSSTKDFDLKGTAAFDATSLSAARASQASAGATGTETVTLSGSRPCSLITLAIAPVAGGSILPQAAYYLSQTRA